MTEGIAASPSGSSAAAAAAAPPSSSAAASGSSIAKAESSASSDESGSNSDSSHTLLWSKSKVYVHPSPYAKHNVPGYLALVRQGPSRPGATILLSFLPESLVEQRHELEKFVRIEYVTLAKGDDEEPRRSLEAVEVDDEEDPDSELIAEPPTSATYAFSLPLTSIYSFTTKTPTISSWYGTVTISQIGGVTLPTLHFHDDESKSTILSMHRAKHSSSNTALSSSYESKLTASTSSPGGQNTLIQRSPSPSPIWGGDELVHQLRKYAHVLRSAIEPSLFLVNPSRSDMEIHSTPIFDDDAIDLPARHSGASGYGASSSVSAWSHDLAEDPFSMSPLHQSLPGRNSPRRNNDLAMDNLTVWAKSARMSVLSSFANFTQQARHASHAVLSHPLAKPYVPHLPGPVQSFAQAGPIPLGPTDGEWEWRTSSIANKSGTGEYYDSARVYLAKWARLVAEEGERNRRKEERLGMGSAAAGQHALADSLAHADAPSSNMEGSELGAFEVLEKMYDLPRPESERAARMAELLQHTDAAAASDVAMDIKEWRSLFDSDTGRPLHSSNEIRRRIFVNGLTNEARKQAWPFLLDATPFETTSEERGLIWQDREVEYHTQKARWQTDEELLQSDAVREQQHRVRVDCLRTDRNQPKFARSKDLAADADAGEDQNPHTAKLGEILLTYGFWEAEQSRKAAESGDDTEQEGLLAGYVQGMSDLCSPIYIICDGDEVKTFWCFVGLMERTKSNFYRDQSGMKTQLLLLQKLISIMDPALYNHLEKADSLNLFFCFRWLLVRFKREFKFDETLAIWESCWAAEPSNSTGLHTNRDLKDAQATITHKARTNGTSDPDGDQAASSNQTRFGKDEKTNGWGLSKSFHLFCALALLELHRDYLIRYLENFDEILQYFNSLTGEFDANTVINKAEVLAKSFQEIASTADRNSAKTGTKAEEDRSIRNFLDILTVQELDLLL